MAKRPEESDDRVVPEGGRKLVPTAAGARGGKAVTASKEGIQLRPSFETAENPQGAEVSATVDHATGAKTAVPKSKRTSREGLPAMTMQGHRAAPAQAGAGIAAGSDAGGRPTGLISPNATTPKSRM